MGNLFGVRRRAPVVTPQDRAILKLKQQRDKIKIYQKRTENDLVKHKELVLQLLENGKKDRALVVLRKKKYMENILDRTDKQLETLEQMVNDIEYTQIEVSVVEGIKVGTDALKQLNSLMDVGDIQDMLADNEEAAEKQREITELLQRSSERYDEEDLLRELETYKDKPEKEVEPKAEEVEPVPEEAPSIPDLPNVPKHKPKETSITDLPEVPEKLPNERRFERQLEPAQ